MMWFGKTLSFWNENMKNLAGVVDCDKYITEELLLAGITPFCLKGERDKHPEVKSTIFGLLGGKHFLEDIQKYKDNEDIMSLFTLKTLRESAEFCLSRNWYYYVAVGYVPMEAAVELYEHPIGRKDVRVEGHCGCPDPREYMKNSTLVAGRRCVSCYHIDSQEGLNLYVEVLKRHNLFE